MSSFAMRCSAFLFAILLFALTMATASAQSVTGSVSGFVTDSSGGVIVGASVTLSNDANGAARTDVTNEEGRFIFSALQPGIYTLRIEREGFQRLERKNTVLTLNENLALIGICGAACQAARRWHRRFSSRGKCSILGMGLAKMDFTMSN